MSMPNFTSASASPVNLVDEDLEFLTSSPPSCLVVVVTVLYSNVADSLPLRSILKRAVEGTDLADISSVCEGTTAIALSNEDYTAAARILCKFADSHENFTVKSGFLDGEVVSIETINELAKLPTRDVLLATVLSAFQAPIAAFARAVQAIVDKDGSAEEAAE